MTETPAKLNPIIRLLPSLTDVAFLMPIVFLFVRLDGAKTLLGDGDTGWHLRTGEWILEHGRVPTADMFSFTRPGEPWFAWEWLWDVIFGFLHQKWGLAPVVLGSTLVLCVTFALLYRLIRRRCPNPLVAIAVTIVACAGSSLHWLARPHLFTMLFLVIFLGILDRAQHDGRMGMLRWLPPLSIIWTNLHGGFLLGNIILLAYIGGEVVAALLAPWRELRIAAFRRALQYAAAFAGCALASLINPYGWKLWSHLYEYLTDPFQYKFITEFFSFNFHHPTAIWIELMLWAGILISVRNATRGEFISLCLVAGMSHIALFAARNIPLFVIAVAPLVAAGINRTLEDLRSANVAQWLRKATATVQEIGDEVASIDVHWRLYPLSILVIAVLGLLLHAPTGERKLKAEFDPKRYPAGALEMLMQKRPASRIFTDDEWGDYLIYRTYPKGKVFVDGRSDFYGGTFDEKFLDALNVKYGWEEYLRKYRVDTVLLSTTSPLAGAMKLSSEWRIEYDDTIAIVFVSATAGRADEKRESTPPTSAALSGTRPWGASVLVAHNHNGWPSGSPSQSWLSDTRAMKLSD